MAKPIRSLQRKAVEYLGIFGGSFHGPASTLARFNNNTNDTGVKRAVVQDTMMTGNRRSQLFESGKRREGREPVNANATAIFGPGRRLLSEVAATLYQSKPSPEIRRAKRNSAGIFPGRPDSDKMVASSRKADQGSRTAALAANSHLV